MNFELGDVLEHRITKEPCMIIKFDQHKRVKLLSWNMMDIWGEDILYIIDNYKKVGHIDLSLLIGKIK